MATIIISFLVAFVAGAVIAHIVTSKKKSHVSPSMEGYRDVVRYLELVGQASSEEFGEISNFIRLDYSELTPAGQVMKSEENALRVRIVETQKFTEGKTFNEWPASKKKMLFMQLGAMMCYYLILCRRCVDAGVMKKANEPADSSSSECSSSEASSSSDSSSSCSSSDESSSGGGSSSDNADYV